MHTLALFFPRCTPGSSDAFEATDLGLRPWEEVKAPPKSLSPGFL